MRMRRPLPFRSWMYSSAAMRLLERPLPSSSKTFRLRILHSGAMPDISLMPSIVSVVGFPSGSGKVTVPQRCVYIEILVQVEMRMIAVDAGIDDRPDDPLAEGSEGVARR